MDDKRLAELRQAAGEARERAERATPGPWAIWEGPSFVGGGEDLCIGAGETWLANMDHRMGVGWGKIAAHAEHEPLQPLNGTECDVCTMGRAITAEQRGNAELIRASRTDVPALAAAVEELAEEVERMRKMLHDLTPGGSNFAGNPQKCADWIEREMALMTRLVVEANAKRREAESVNA